MMNKPINITNDVQITEFNSSIVSVSAATTVKARQDCNISTNQVDLNTSDSEINCSYVLGYN